MVLFDRRVMDASQGPWNFQERLNVLLERQKHSTHQQVDCWSGLGSSPQALVKRARTVCQDGLIAEDNVGMRSQPQEAALPSPSRTNVQTAAAPVALQGDSEAGRDQVQRRLGVLLRRQAAVELANRNPKATAAGEPQPDSTQLAGATEPQSRRRRSAEGPHLQQRLTVLLQRQAAAWEQQQGLPSTSDSQASEPWPGCRQPTAAVGSQAGVNGEAEGPSLAQQVQQRLDVLLQRHAAPAESIVPANIRDQGNTPLPAAWLPVANAGAQPQLRETLGHACQQDGQLVQQRLQVLLQRHAALGEAGGLLVTEENEGDMPPAARLPAVSQADTSGLQARAGPQCQEEGRELHQRLNILLQRQQGEQRPGQGKE
ncbi:hypothetical protein N2152v2_007777 [Parachlorella kessleri]